MNGTLGLLLVAATVLLGALLIGHSHLRWSVKRLVLAGFALRIVGGLTYLYAIGAFYGVGDYVSYFQIGNRLAETAAIGEPNTLLDPFYWTTGRWWGTTFVERLTGLLILIIGPTLPGAFIVFSVVSYTGIVAMGVAFFRAYPHIPLERYFAWVALFPSLWFWPTALGKDALVLCGVGLATLGFVGKRNHPNWVILTFGAALVFMIRPQVAATLAFAIALGQWLGSGLRWTPARMMQGAVLLVVGIGVISMSSGALGVELFSPDEVENYLDTRAQILASQGGSALDVSSEGINPLIAPINTLMRPFLWEARSVTSLLACIEVIVVWGIGWKRRSEIKAFVAAHKKSRLFWAALVFIVVYATALGMAASNLGLIARQRVHILPFVFLFFAGAGESRKRRIRAPLLQTHRTPQPVG